MKSTHIIFFLLWSQRNCSKQSHFDEILCRDEHYMYVGKKNFKWLKKNCVSERRILFCFIITFFFFCYSEDKICSSEMFYNLSLIFKTTFKKILLMLGIILKRIFYQSSFSEFIGFQGIYKHRISCKMNRIKFINKNIILSRLLNVVRKI